MSKKVNKDYHTKAKSLDVRGGYIRSGFDTELTYNGQALRVIGPVIGAFGEITNDAHAIAKSVAEELALGHISFYGDKALKIVRGFPISQLY